MLQRTLQMIGLTLCGVVLLHGCATPLDIGTADRTLTPPQAIATIETVRNRTVAWGGVIVGAKNLTDKTQLEILAYPLDESHRPKQTAAPLGRFLAYHSGYLETADYKEGRLVTIIGTLVETISGNIGEAHYTYPVLTATRIHLWPVEPPPSSEPRFHFGVGIGIGL
jgi:outer membrane lipoprotein